MPFSLVDIPTPSDVNAVVHEIIEDGASLLLPPLKERMELLRDQLPQGKDLSQGQEILLEIILNSLEEPTYVASMLGYSCAPENFVSKDLHAVEELMNTLLLAFNANTVSI